MYERRERRERKNNIVIKGVKWRETKRLEQEVKEFIRESLKVDIEVKKVRKIRITDKICNNCRDRQLGTKKGNNEQEERAGKRHNNRG